MPVLYYDSETYSETPIKAGVYRYAADAELMIATYAIDDGPVQVWDATLDPEMPDDLRYYLGDEGIAVIAHSAMFDRSILRLAKNTLIEVPIPRWRCTMVQALAHGLPGGLDKLCAIFGISEDSAKLKTGKQLIQLFCKPRPKNNKLRRATRETHPAEWKEFIDYAKSDITAMRELHKKMPTWNSTGQELALYHLDQVINDRGFLVDLDLANAALAAVDLEQSSLKSQIATATDDQVGSATQRDKLLEYLLEAYGVSLPDMQAATLTRRIEDPDLPEEVKEILRIRLQATTTSTSKYKTLIAAVSDDDRLRGTIQFDGASRTRRACLAEGSLILVRDDLGRVYNKPVEQVEKDDRVWDGESWVSHEGVVYSGTKEVLTHDGVSATMGHIVWLDGETKCPMSEAAKKKLPLWTGNMSCTPSID